MLHPDNEAIDDNQLVFIFSVSCTNVGLMLISSLRDKEALEQASHIPLHCSPPKIFNFPEQTLKSHLIIEREARDQSAWKCYY